MNGNCHFIFGASVGVLGAILTHSDPEASTLLISTCLIGSIFPDIDSPRSNFGQLTRPVSSVIDKIRFLSGKESYQHRNLLHWPVLYIVGLIAALNWFPYLMGFFLGALSHLFLDMWNPLGIPLLPGVRLRFAKFKSGHPGSYVITWLFTVLCVGLSVFAQKNGL